MAASSNHSPHHSPRHSGGGGDASASPKSARGAVARGVVSPWTQVFRSSESESIISSTPPAAVAAAVAAPSSPLASQGQQTNNSSPDWSPSNTAAAAASSSSSLSSADDSSAVAQPESFDNGTGSGNAAKKPAWNKPSNGDVEVGPVMGAVSWPALSESARASPKSSSSDPFKATSDGLVSVSQGNGIASSTQKQVINSNTNPSLLSNNMTPTRQKSMKRGGGSSSGNVTANGGFPQPAPPLGPVPEMSSNDTGKHGSVVPESPRGHAHKESGHRGGFGSQSHSGNEHSQQRNSFRRGNGGPHPRGDGSFHHNGGKRDQDRGNPEWNSHRSFNGRDSHMQTQRVVPRGFIRPPSHVSTPFIPPPPMPVPVRHFGNPLLYPDIPPPVFYVTSPPPDSLRGVPMVAPLPPHTMLFPVMDPQLHTKIVNQIDYYFSNENLIKDTFLRKNMDDQGWVPINLIASFKKVMLLTNNVQLILDAVRTSSIVEVKDDKVRKRDDWFRWIMPSVQLPNTVSSPQSLGRTSRDMLSATIHNLSLDERTNKQGDATFLSRSSSGDLNSQPQLSSVEGTGQATFQAAYERSIPTRSSSN